jgi:hypothetical protein
MRAMSKLIRLSLLLAMPEKKRKAAAKSTGLKISADITEYEASGVS